MKICVLGVGGIGAYYGGQLARAGHHVALYARGENLTAIRTHGLEIKSAEGSWRVPIAATDKVEERGAPDLAILAVKSYSLTEIAPVVKRVADAGATILPFLNGVEATDTLVELGVPRQAIVGGVTRISVARTAPGVVERRGAFQSVIVGELDRRASERTTRIAAAFRDAGVDSRTSTQIETDLWEKFVFIASMAAACALARSPIGPVRDAPLGRRMLQRAVQEVVDVATARRISLPAEEAALVRGAIGALPPGTKPSFLLDVEAGGKNEAHLTVGGGGGFLKGAPRAPPPPPTPPHGFRLY